MVTLQEFEDALIAQSWHLWWPWNRARARRVIRLAIQRWPNSTAYNPLDESPIQRRYWAIYKSNLRERYEDSYGSWTIILLVIEIVIKLIIWWLSSRNDRSEVLAALKREASQV